MGSNESGSGLDAVPPSGPRARSRVPASAASKGSEGLGAGMFERAETTDLPLGPPGFERGDSTAADAVGACGWAGPGADEPPKISSSPVVAAEAEESEGATGAAPKTDSGEGDAAGAGDRFAPPCPKSSWPKRSSSNPGGVAAAGGCEGVRPDAGFGAAAAAAIAACAGVGGMVAGRTSAGGDGVSSEVAGAPASPLRTTKTVPHLLHRTLTPRSVTLSSPILKRVWQEAHWVIIEGQDRRSTPSIAAAKARRKPKRCPPSAPGAGRPGTCRSAAEDRILRSFLDFWRPSTRE